jgi:phenylacetate-CoA ligase
VRLLAPLVAVRTMSLGHDLQANLRELNDFRPTVVQGFPSWLLVLAQAASEAGVALPQVPLIYTSSEALTATARRTLERAYQARVVDVYGSTEFKEIAVQCRNGRYHVNFESVYVESVPSPETGVPRLLVTTLLNRAMPLIRYELGDTGRVEEGACPCGRWGPYLCDLSGRLSEVLSFPDGTQLSPYLLTTVLEQRPMVKHFRVVHERPWQLRIELRANPSLSAAEERELESSLKEILPSAAAVRFVALADRGTYSKRRAVSREF